jgi:hypothetical protein
MEYHPMILSPRQRRKRAQLALKLGTRAGAYMGPTNGDMNEQVGIEVETIIQRKGEVLTPDGIDLIILVCLESGYGHKLDDDGVAGAKFDEALRNFANDTDDEA